MRPHNPSELEETVRHVTTKLLNADNEEERAEVANEIVCNVKVTSMVLMLLAECIFPIFDVETTVQ